MDNGRQIISPLVSFTFLYVLCISHAAHAVSLQSAIYISTKHAKCYDSW